MKKFTDKKCSNKFNVKKNGEIIKSFPPKLPPKNSGEKKSDNK